MRTCQDQVDHGIAFKIRSILGNCQDQVDHGAAVNIRWIIRQLSGSVWIIFQDQVDHGTTIMEQLSGSSGSLTSCQNHVDQEAAVKIRWIMCNMSGSENNQELEECK